MDNRITVNVTSAVKDFYPGLTTKQTDYIARSITKGYDYASLYDEIYEQINEIACTEGIELEGKDGVNESEDKTLLGTSDGAFYYKNGNNVVELFEPHVDPYGGH